MKVIVFAVVGALALNGCTADFVTKSEAEVILRIVQITATSGAGPGSGVGTVLNSDVSFKGSIINDNATLVVDLVPKNRLLIDVGPVNDVRLERYEIRYIRSDGRNVEGVDVPYRITGPLNWLVHSTQESTQNIPIVVVRHQAKAEPPLRNLKDLGGALILTCIAEITIHGVTTSGKTVSATGRLQINFADFADSTT